MTNEQKNTPDKKDVSKLTIPEFEELVKREREFGNKPDDFFFRQHDRGRYE